ncbi:MAG: TonB-dependent receptor plug domain-containing protein, partial [Pyrinomonadaceae bacterium]|nr:TonB-dependent receptor plug domain-containing protein [Pyrinomonadaceae bacterium]
MRSYIPKLVTLAILLFALAGAIFGQSAHTLQGRVVDANGAAIPAAAVSVVRDDVYYRLRTTTGETGEFTVAGLVGGNYDITVKSASFAAETRRVSLPAGDRVEIVLSPEPVAAEISVTTSLLAGTSESLDEVPGAVERLDAAILENSRVFNFSEALRKISGVNVRDEEGFGLRPNIGIRGTNPTRSSKILLLEDGIPLTYAPYGDNASYYHPPIERYTSVEVMKGSSQIAFGPQTVAGAINYLTPNPTEKPTFGIRLTGGNRSYFNGSFFGSGTLGKTGIYAGYSRKQGDGARENISSKLNDITTKIVQPINDRNSLTFKFSYYGEDSNVAYTGATEVEYAAGQRSNPFESDFFYGDRFGFSTNYTSVFTPRAVLSTNFYANHFRRHWWRQASTSDHRPFRLNSDPDCLGMADLNTTCGNLGNLREYDTIGVEPKFTFTYDAGTVMRGELQTGFRIHWESQDRTQKLGDLPNSRDGVISERNIRKTLAYSGFVQNRFVFGTFAVTPGVRFERIELFRENRLVTPFATGESVVTEVIPGIGFAFSGLPKTTI